MEDASGGILSAHTLAVFAKRALHALTVVMSTRVSKQFLSGKGADVCYLLLGPCSQEIKIMSKQSLPLLLF